MERPEIINLMAEPDYPLHDTVLVSFKSPDWCCHESNEYCDIEEPHHVDNCNYWKDLENN